MFSMCTFVLVALLVFKVSAQIPPPVIVLSFDGLCKNFINETTSNDFHEFQQISATALFLHSTFQEHSLPNHHCIVTGVCPNERGTPAEETNTGVPIWKQNEEAGPGRYSGVFMWPGIRSMYPNQLPTHRIVELNVAEINTPENVVKEFLQWIFDTEKPANLVMAHFDIKSANGHVYNTNINEYNDYISVINNIFKVILEQLIEMVTSEFPINLIVLSTNRLALQTLPIFMAWGPAFKANCVTKAPVSIKEVYPLLKHLLNIGTNTSDLPHNSQMTVMKQLLKNDPSIIIDVER